jgi:hypothetical protein
MVIAAPRQLTVPKLSRVLRYPWGFRVVPGTALSDCNNVRKLRELFDQLVGTCEQGGRDGRTE